MQRLDKIKEWRYNLSPTLNHQEQTICELIIFIGICILYGIYYLFSHFAQ